MTARAREKQMAEFDAAAESWKRSTMAFIKMITVDLPNLVYWAYSLAHYWDGVRRPVKQLMSKSTAPE